MLPIALFWSFVGLPWLFLEWILRRNAVRISGKCIMKGELEIHILAKNDDGYNFNQTLNKCFSGLNVGLILFEHEGHKKIRKTSLEDSCHCSTGCFSGQLFLWHLCDRQNKKEKRMRKNLYVSMFVLLVAALVVLSACGTAPTATATLRLWCKSKPRKCR